MKEKYFVVADSISKWKIDNSFERNLSYRKYSVNAVLCA